MDNGEGVTLEMILERINKLDTKMGKRMHSLETKVGKVGQEMKGLK